jgi:hypothetical protein
MASRLEQASKAAYEAYGVNTGGKSLITGEDLPEWDRLRGVIRIAWRAAAIAAIVSWKGSRNEG